MKNMSPRMQAPNTAAHPCGSRLALKALVMRYPRPFWRPPKYSATKAVTTATGAEMRTAMGVAVFAGMIGVTLFGLFLTPVFYVLLRTLAARRGQRSEDAPDRDLDLDGALPVPSAQH